MPGSHRLPLFSSTLPYFQRGVCPLEDGCLHFVTHLFDEVSCETATIFSPLSPCGLTFTWSGCYGLCPRHKSIELAHSFFFFFFNSVLVPFSVLMALSTVFHSINSPDNPPFSHSVLPVIFLPYWSVQLYSSSWKPPSGLI